MGFDEAGVGDMVQLSILDEAAMVENLRERFNTGLPYTLCGQICISVNPFKWLPIYSDDAILRYHAAGNPFSSEAPHIFAVVHDTLRRLMQGADTGSPLPSQSVLVSGESGAGKTEATKICMQYLAKTDALREVQAGRTQGTAAALTDRVLKCNPVLEAFGNAQTSRNDNSSRFGKFLQLHYSHAGRQLGASISTYLLERSRVVRPPQGEANYHVLYALAGGVGDTMRQQLCLCADEDAYGAVLPPPGGSGKRPAREERAAKWEEITQALRVVGFSEDEVSCLARLLAGVLALASLRFVGIDGEDGQRCSAPENAEAVERAANCLEVRSEDLSSALCTRRTFMSTGEQYVKALDEVQATDAAHALAKAVYGRMFDAIVTRMNALTSCEGEKPGGFIGILDIFGFEHFETNSFEQLCINFANEMLQQQFNADTFKQQQVEYEAEGVPWEKIAYEDNAERIELLALRRTGAFALLDEECRLQTGSAASFVDKLQRAHPSHTFLSFPKLQRKGEGPQFTITHYAGDVRYDTQLFLQKNTDPLHPDLEMLVKRSRGDYLRELFVHKADAGESPVVSRRNPSQAMWSATVGTRFKEGVSSLMETVSATHVHYVRCVKPNARALAAGDAGAFDEALVADQLRCAGMLEAVRISRAAFPHRLPIEVFAQLFRVLLTTPNPASVEELAQALLPEGGFCVGKTKVFLAPGVMAGLEERRDATRAVAATSLQSARRGRAARLYLRAALKAARSVQSAYRVRAARRASAARRMAVTRIQCCVRRVLAVKLCQRLRRISSAVKLQAAVRRRRVIKHYLRERRATVVIQSRARVTQAMKRFKTELAADRLRKSYLGQLQEARERLESEANVKEQLASDKARLEQQLATSYSREAYEARLAAEREQRERASELAALLGQQDNELNSLRAQLAAGSAALQREQAAREREERKAEQANLQLSLERSDKQKLQKGLDAEKAAAANAREAAAAAREEAAKIAKALSGGGADDALVPASTDQALSDSIEAATRLTRERSARLKELSSELEAAKERESQLRNKLAHAQSERQRERHKLESNLDAMRIKQAQWESERVEFRRHTDHLQGEVNKRDQWLKKAKDIITEYQKRTLPLASPLSQAGSTACSPFAPR